MIESQQESVCPCAFLCHTGNSRDEERMPGPRPGLCAVVTHDALGFCKSRLVSETDLKPKCHVLKNDHEDPLSYLCPWNFNLWR